MCAFELRPAVRENVPLLIGLAGGTGSGKTLSAMKLAKGLSGGKRFALVDTESGRAKAYADEYEFDSGDLVAPFTPESYTQAIVDIDNLKKYPVIVVDSCSHEYSGEGGVLDMQEAELDRMAGRDYQKREACKMASWIKPKMEHKAFVNRLLQVRSHLILCFRAEPKTEIAKENGKTIVRPKQGLTGLDGWFPICEKNMPYELTAYFLLLADKPGVPQPIKLMDKHKAFFPAGKPITEEAGMGLAEWARGVKSTNGKPDEDAVITKEQFDDLWALITESDARKKACQELAKTKGYTQFKTIKQCDLATFVEFARGH
jgi:hypothetical protein